MDPSQSFNHPGEIEGNALGRFYTKIRDDLMALPEKFSGDRRGLPTCIWMFLG